MQQKTQYQADIFLVCNLQGKAMSNGLFYRIEQSFALFALFLSRLIFQTTICFFCFFPISICLTRSTIVSSVRHSPLSYLASVFLDFLTWACWVWKYFFMIDSSPIFAALIALNKLFDDCVRSSVIDGWLGVSPWVDDDGWLG